MSTDDTELELERSILIPRRRHNNTNSKYFYDKTTFTLPLTVISNKPVSDMIRSLAAEKVLTATPKDRREIYRHTIYVNIGDDDVINDVVRPVSTIRQSHIDTPYRATLC